MDVDNAETEDMHMKTHHSRRAVMNPGVCMCVCVCVCVCACVTAISMQQQFATSGVRLHELHGESPQRLAPPRNAKDRKCTSRGAPG